MASLLKRRKKRLILDVGTRNIRLCELARTNTGYQLTKYFQKEIPSTPDMEDEQVRNLRLQALNALLKEAKVRTKKTVFAMPGQSVFTRTRPLPPVPEYKVSQIVRYEIQQQIPFSLDQIAMDYQVLDRTEQGGYEVMMAAIKVEVVDKQIELLKEAKRTIDTVDVAPLAAYNWLKRSGEMGEQGDCVALINIGATTTDIVIERDNQFRFTRPLNLGGNEVTEAIAENFNLSFADAEKLKRQKGFAPSGDPARDGKGGEVIGQGLQRLVSETNRSFSFFRSLPGGGQVNRVVLSGGGAALRNIGPYLQQQLGMEVRVAQPLKGIAVGPGAQQINDNPEAASVVLGLALRCLEQVPIEINLIPPQVMEAMRQKEQAIYWSLSLATLAVIMASIIPVKANENRVVRERIQMEKAQIQRFDPQMAQQIEATGSIPSSQKRQELIQARNEVEQVSNLVQELDRARENRTFWLDELTMVNEARPTTNRIWFSLVETMRAGAPQQRQETGDMGMMMPGMGLGMGGPNAQGGNGNGEGGAPDMSDPMSALMGNMGGMGLGMGMDGGGGGGRAGGRGGDRGGVLPEGMEINGFPGVDGRGGAGGAGGMGGMGGDMMSGLMGMMPGGGGGGGGGRPDQEVPQIENPNGLMVQGLSESDEGILIFVENLRNSQRTLPGGRVVEVKDIHFNQASVQRVAWNTIYNAPVTSPISGRGGRGGGGGGMGMGMDLMAGLGGMGGMGGMGGGQTQRIQGQGLFTFTIFIEFERARPGQTATQTGGLTQAVDASDDADADGGSAT